MTVPTTLRCGDRQFEIDTRTFVMGVVNITPDSFSDGGRYLDVTAAYDHAMRLLDEGADVVDLGAESTRPGATPIDADEELARLVPVLERLVGAGVTCLSVDTYKAEVAEIAIDVGAAWINDTSGLADARMARVARAADALIVMHQRPMSVGKSGDDVDYGDVVTDVRGKLQSLVEQAVHDGVSRERIIVDPGIGFGKTVADNLSLLSRLDEMTDLGPVLVGPSRKRFLAAVAALESTQDRDAATLGACCLAALHGASLVRVHAVRQVRAALALTDAARSHAPTQSRVDDTTDQPGRAKAIIALGSNLGDRVAFLRQALAALPATSRMSQVFETAPVGGPPGQAPYLNMVIELETTLDPFALLRLCQRIELAAGRERAVHWGPRTLDLDLLFYDDTVIRSRHLTLPHPRIDERPFVLVPLLEVAPHRVTWDQPCSVADVVPLGPLCGL
ncbi:hypothetical protein BH18ACT3_BH18ACT3_18470 [soil metagenome]